ncbi:MAG: hypothetical protein JW983_06030 [Elusimicrobia bacterium]|nr:hypothetical protein [Elusimicrobiota bacterium]
MGYRNFLTGFLKPLIAIILLPLLLGLAKSFAFLITSLIPLKSSEIWFVSGFAVFFLIFLPRPFMKGRGLSKPLPNVLYVFGHELTHAIWVVLFRGKVKEFKVFSERGSVLTNKSNFLIALSPYFFPIYTFLIIIIFYILAFFFNVTKWIEWLFFLVGVSYSYHIFLTFKILSIGQSDIKKTGRIFSYVIIIMLNLIITVVILKFISPERISVSVYFGDGMSCAVKIYEYLWGYLADIWKKCINQFWG